MVPGKTAVVALLIAFFFSSSGAAQPDSLEVPIAQSRFIPALKSAALPGWGQFSRGEWLLGAFYLAGEAFLAADAHYYWQSQYDKPGWDQPARTFDRDMAYGLASWYGIGALFCAMDVYYADGKKRDGNPTLTALQSVVFPGWGQLANGQRWKAAGMFVMQTGLAFAVLYQHENFLFHDGQGDDYEARFYKNNRNRLIWWSIGAVIFSSVDAFVDCHLRNWDVSEDLSLAPTYFPEQGVLGLGVSIPLPGH